MRRWIAVAAMGALGLVGCAPSEPARMSSPGSTLSTDSTVLLTVSGTLTFGDGWEFAPGDFPRTVYNGEECWPVGDLEDREGDPGPQLVVEAGTGAVIGEAEFGSGEISGLGSSGFELPSQLETVLIASESLMRRAACSFTFSVDLPEESPSYWFIVNGRPGVVYSQDDLDALNWVVELEQS